MSTYAYVYRYGVDGIQGKGRSVNEYLSLAASPGIYFICFGHDGVWSVLEINDYGNFNFLHNLEIPKEVKLYHLITN